MAPSSAIGKLLDNYSTRVTEEMEQQAADRGMSMREVLIVASMIEKEAANAEEAPTVASVIYNRLAGNMPLQIDATTDYAMQLAGRGNEKTDYNIDSPYNTYVVTGLPAGPICNQGLSSIKAALAPAVRSIISTEDREKIHGTQVRFALRPRKVFLFDKETGERI